MRTFTLLCFLFFSSQVALAQGTDWVQQSPPAISTDLNDLHMFDTGVAIAVGSGGKIIKTTDSGQTWTSLSSGTSSNLAVVRFIDQNTGWVAGASGTLLKTTDGGTSWVSQNSGSTSTLTSLYFVDAQTGWSTSGDDMIRKTTDGGDSWAVQYTATGTYVSLEDVYFRNASFGFVVGFSLGGPDVFRTTDGGQTWSTQDYSNSWFQTVCFLDDQIGWAAGITASTISYATPDPFGMGGGLSISGQKSTIWKTTDGGLTWAAGVFPTSNWLNGVLFTDANNGMLVGTGGIIIQTTDGGTNWVSQLSPLGSSHALQSIRCSGSGGWIVGSGGEILRTTDAGSSWNYQSGAGTTKNLNSLFFSDASTGWAVGASGTIIKTTDGGVVWRGQTSSVSYELYSVQFVNSSTGWAVGASGTILKSTNGGSSWSRQSTSTFNSLTSVDFVDTQTGWAVGYGGTILKTTNGGSNWAAVATGTTARFYGILFTSSSSGLAVADSGIILRTTDGGSSWNRISSGTSRKLLCVHGNQDLGWIGAENGLVLRTADGGLSWTASVVQSNGYTIYDDFTSIFFTDASTGWASTDGGKLYKTANGGVTWARLTTGNSQSLNSVFFANSSAGWIAGTAGLILKTSNGGGIAAFSPTLSLPADRSTRTPTDVTLSWTACDGALSYTLNVSNSPSFPSPLLVEAENVAGASYDLNNLTRNTTYYWRVKVIYAVGESEWSPTFGFVTVGSGWSAQFSETASELYAVRFSDTLNGWATGRNYTTLHTTDGGSTWSSQETDLYQGNAVYCPNASTALIAGSWGIVRTTDGGGTWTTPAGAGSNALYALEFVDASTGYAAGLSNTILKTTDGGETWNELSSGTSYVSFYSICFLTAQRGWVVGSSGTIINTTDGGATWNAQISGSYAYLRSVRFTDAQTGWVCGYGGVILKTTNGGTTWSSQTSGTSKNLFAMSMIDGQTGYVVGERGTILKTSDAGVNWGHQITGLANTLYSCQFKSASVGWAVGSNGLILKTTSAGGRLATIPLAIAPRDSVDSLPIDVTFSWRASAGAASYHLQCARVPDFSTVALDASTVADTTYQATGLKANSTYYWRVAANYDEGPTDWSNTNFFETIGSVWNVLYEPAGYAPTFHAVFFTSPLAGFAGGGGEIVRTTDGGLTWETDYLSTYTEVNSICFVDASNGYLVGSGGIIFKTTDRGLSWNQVPSGTANDLYAVYFSDASTGWIIGDGGTALRTTDGGSTWIPQSLGTTQRLVSMSFVSTLTGWISTNYGKLLKTTDGGNTWITQLEGSTYARYYNFPLHFVNATTGWFCNDTYGRMEKTTDGGSTWTSQNTWVSTSLNDLHFLDALNGWAVGDDGTVVMTDDGGDLWQVRKSNTEHSLYSLFVLNDSLAWAAGGYSTIMRMSRQWTATVVEPGSEAKSTLPLEYALYQNYPNPFNPATTIVFELPRRGDVLLRVFNVLGQEIATLASGSFPPGRFKAQWDAQGFPSGVYFYRLESGSFKGTQKMILLR
jgi:photosystem II stability/assembly factor-like uncharacterized protein